MLEITRHIESAVVKNAYWSIEASADYDSVFIGLRSMGGERTGLGMTPSEARGFAKAIRELADQAERNNDEDA